METYDLINIRIKFDVVVQNILIFLNAPRKNTFVFTLKLKLPSGHKKTGPQSN